MDAIPASLNFPDARLLASRNQQIVISMACYKGTLSRKTSKWANFQVCAFITNLFFSTIS